MESAMSSSVRSGRSLGNRVELIGTYGGDETHALSAWTSTHREITDERQERMGKLLNMLAEEGHHTPFEKSMLHFVVDVETASHIHLLKHRVGVSVNGESARYKEHKNDRYYVPPDWPEDLRADLIEWCNAAFEKYHTTVARLEPLVGRKRAKESARFYLPYASQLTFDVSFNFRSFMHFQGLRNGDESHAQMEIKTVAQNMIQLVKKTGDFDLSLEAFGY